MSANAVSLELTSVHPNTLVPYLQQSIEEESETTISIEKVESVVSESLSTENRIEVIENSHNCRSERTSQVALSILFGNVFGEFCFWGNILIFKGLFSYFFPVLFPVIITMTSGFVSALTSSIVELKMSIRYEGVGGLNGVKEIGVIIASSIAGGILGFVPGLLMMRGAMGLAESTEMIAQSSIVVAVALLSISVSSIAVAGVDEYAEHPSKNLSGRILWHFR